MVVAPDDLDAAAGPTLGQLDRHHLARVLRLRTGETVTATDGAGRWRVCTWRGEGHPLQASGPVTTDARPTPALTVGFVPVKGDRPEWIVQKLTEIGIDRIVVLQSARSVIRWEGDRREAHLERLRRVAHQAVMQARRVFVPEVVGVASLAQTSGALAHFGGGPPTLATPTVLVGPEGGWTPEEVAGRVTVGLGSGVLRAETATVAVGVLLSVLRDGIPTDGERIGW